MTLVLIADWLAAANRRCVLDFGLGDIAVQGTHGGLDLADLVSTNQHLIGREPAPRFDNEIGSLKTAIVEIDVGRLAAAKRKR